MSTVIYPALATGGRDSGYAATFPDLPGCTASGTDLGDLLSKARDALRSHLERLSHEGEEWPIPSSVEAVTQPAANGNPAAVLLVDVSIEEQPVRVNISISERLLKRIDETAERRGMTRSGFIAQAARQHLGDSTFHSMGGTTGWNKADWEAASRRMQDELTTMGRRLNDNLGPDSSFARNMAELDDKLSDVIRRTADSVAAAIRRRQVERQTGTSANTDEPPRNPDEPPRPNA
jgi:predicted RNase H-like HicB family nuclease